MADERSLTILHISDMQFGPNHRFCGFDLYGPNPRDTLFERLHADLDDLNRDKGLVADVVICTGDLAEQGMEKEFALAFDFLARTAAHLGLLRNRVVVIPGNHDINHGSVEMEFARAKRHGTKPGCFRIGAVHHNYEPRGQELELRLPAHLASGSEDATVRLWNTADFRELPGLRHFTNPVRIIGWSPDGRYLAGGFSDGAVRVWEAPHWYEMSKCDLYGRGGITSLD